MFYYYLFGCVLSIIGAYWGHRGALWFTAWATARFGNNPTSQMLINSLMAGVGLTLMLLLVTLSTFTA